MAIGIVPFVAVLGLVMDYGEAAVCKGKMQRAVDSAALAGAGALPDTTAGDRAAMMADRNYAIYDDLDVSFGTEEITVSMERDVPTRFMRIFGKNEVPVRVTAKAEKPQPVGKVTGHLMPFCIINPNTNYDEDDDLVPSNWGKRFILQFGEDNLLIQDWANGDLPVGEDAPGIDPDYSKNNSEGWRAALRLDLQALGMDIGGADAFIYNFLNGYLGTIGINDIVPVLTGNMTGPVADTRAERLFGEEDFEFPNFDPEKDFDMARVVHVPIISLLDEGSTTDRYTIDDYYAGGDWDHTYVIIDGFAPFYILTYEEMGDVDGDGKAKDSNWIVGYFIPGTRAPIHSDGGGSDMGMMTVPKLIN